MEDGKKRLMCPFQLEADLATQVESNVESIRGGGKDRILVNVYSKNQSQNMRVEQIAGVKFQVSEDTSLSNTSGLVFIQNYHITDMESFTAGVNDQCSVREIVKADWIRSRNQNTEGNVITLKCDKLPEYIRIPGESQRTKNTNTMSNQCLSYHNQCQSLIMVILFIIQKRQY